MGAEIQVGRGAQGSVGEDGGAWRSKRIVCGGADSIPRVCIGLRIHE